MKLRHSGESRNPVVLPAGVAGYLAENPTKTMSGYRLFAGMMLFDKFGKQTLSVTSRKILKMFRYKEWVFNKLQGDALWVKDIL